MSRSSVYGASDASIAVKGFGPTGVSGQSISSGGTGVVGRGDGYGVQGLGYHTGVRGSANGYGGAFEGGLAPLRLVPTTTAGHPTTSTHQQGELVVDVNGVLWVCITAGNPGSWVQIVVQRA